MINRENLLKLAQYVAALPDDYKQFKMETYCITDRDYYPNPSETKEALSIDCNTCGCLLGHGPAAGIESNSDTESWDGYCDRVFGVPEDSEEWEYFFGTQWPDDAKAAAKRIFDYLETGSLTQ